MKSRLESYPYNTEKLYMAYGMVNGAMLISLTHESGDFKLKTPLSTVEYKLKLKGNWHFAEENRGDFDLLAKNLRDFMNAQETRPSKIVFVGDANLGASDYHEISPLIDEVLKGLLTTNIPVNKYLYSNGDKVVLEGLKEDALMHDTRAHRTYVGPTSEVFKGAAHLIQHGTMFGHDKLPTSHYDPIQRDIPDENKHIGEFKNFKDVFKGKPNDQDKSSDLQP
ncbi:hypothetical protein [Legionella sp. WA2022007384]